MRWLSYCWALIVLFGCTQADQTPPATKQVAGYELYFFENTVLSQQRAERIAANQEWNMLRDPDLAQASYVISDTAIVEYNWPQQTLIVQNPWAEANQKTPFFMSEGTTLVIFNGQIIRAYQRELSISSKYIAPETAVMYHELPANGADPTLKYRLTQANATSPAAIVSDDPAIAEAVKNHLRQLGKLVD
ncbi:hypothetical protein [Herpetosiphon geysericola]|uniref:Lipoprotein n=1 Tax=Herpetosiphon geysericola TaxID=70996 RepID=A0A0N8GPV8_9CHLR|nr:hypothetical protein [Herpetosiphon geysericola]KPL81978.1 hypothetical protein SE18_20535 [Herpetosiphon geysericola]